MIMRASTLNTISGGEIILEANKEMATKLNISHWFANLKCVNQVAILFDGLYDEDRAGPQQKPVANQTLKSRDSVRSLKSTYANFRLVILHKQ